MSDKKERIILDVAYQPQVHGVLQFPPVKVGEHHGRKTDDEDDLIELLRFLIRDQSRSLYKSTDEHNDKHRCYCL